MSKEYPLLCCDSVVRAVLSRAQTQDRRPIRCGCNTIHPTHHQRLLGDWGLSKPPYQWDGESQLWNLHGKAPKPGDWIEHVQIDVNDHATVQVRCPWSKGDVLWVRETLRCVRELPERLYFDVLYADDDHFNETDIDAHSDHDDWLMSYRGWWGRGRDTQTIPSIHMPRWACRLTLEVLDVKIERVQAATDGTAFAEGYPGRNACELGPLAWFATLWDSLYAAKGYGWDANPWVFVTTFKVIDKETT